MPAGLASIAPIERQTLAGQVHRDLRQLIMSGRLAPGDQLSMREMAAALGVSVMPVRDAVNRLVAEQALVVQRNRGVLVPLTTRAEFQELATIRIEVEGFAAERAAAARSAAELAELAELARAYRDECHHARPDLAAALRLNMRFHFAVYAAAGLPRLRDMIEALWLRAGPLITLETRATPGRLLTGDAWRRHLDVTAAIGARAGPAARRAIAQDIQTTTSYILEHGILATAPTR